MKRYHTLTKEEERVLCLKGTERAGSGEYIHYTKEGVYLCRRCDAPLYLSSDKFPSHCGWPSFDDQLDGAVEQRLDEDGERIEIICSRCSAHLGHLFTQEGFTKKNVRHCVNSISMTFIPSHTETGYEIAHVAGGCFWGVQHLFVQREGVISVVCGYTGGHVVFPSYQQVCSSKTGHREACQIIFDPKITSYEAILRFFFEIHDPTDRGGQGPDRGQQYVSAIFYFSRKQQQIATSLISLLENKGLSIATTLQPASAFYPAEEFHQNYYKKTGKSPYCHVYSKRF